MKKLFLFFTLTYTSFFIAQETQKIKYPCSSIVDNYKINKGLRKWPKFKKGQTLKINSFINYQYPTEDSRLNSEWFEQRRPWWTKIENDPWSEYPFFGEKFIPPKLNFKKNVDDNLRWKCGYSYMIDIPENFKKNKTYPLVIFLHGGIDTDQKKFLWRERQRKSFYMSEDDPYIIAAPIKLGLDWYPKKSSRLFFVLCKQDTLCRIVLRVVHDNSPRCKSRVAVSHLF